MAWKRGGGQLGWEGGDWVPGWMDHDGMECKPDSAGNWQRQRRNETGFMDAIAILTGWTVGGESWACPPCRSDSLALPGPFPSTHRDG